MTTDTTSCAKKSRGRPKVFDREAALDKAMTLFWQHGYEATSLADLVEATGAKAPTLYAEFTNKEGLFRAVLDRYITRFASKHKAQLFCEEKAWNRRWKITSQNCRLLYQYGHAGWLLYD
ncbi:TetR family regulatory protein [Salmonella enterica subsp. enterica serovar Gaminara str. ATCC BAA-711]|nr:TetR family regulatory protein [Salmonella enterica subsp. enterica serovar Gaminara str. ATCC BAA-711]